MNILLSAGGYNATQKSMNSGRGRERRVVLCSVLWKTDLDCWRDVLRANKKGVHPFNRRAGEESFLEKKAVVVKNKALSQTSVQSGKIRRVSSICYHSDYAHRPRKSRQVFSKTVRTNVRTDKFVLLLDLNHRNI